MTIFQRIRDQLKILNFLKKHLIIILGGHLQIKKNNNIINTISFNSLRYVFKLKVPWYSSIESFHIHKLIFTTRLVMKYKDKRRWSWVWKALLRRNVNKQQQFIGNESDFIGRVILPQSDAFIDYMCNTVTWSEVVSKVWRIFVWDRHELRLCW